jgi:hypothetical protein
MMALPNGAILSYEADELIVFIRWSGNAACLDNWQITRQSLGVILASFKFDFAGLEQSAPFALGARRRDIIGLVLKKGMAWTLLGIGLGSVAALALARLMKSLLFGVSATDAGTFVAVAIFLAAVALLAC